MNEPIDEVPEEFTWHYPENLTLELREDGLFAYEVDLEKCRCTPRKSR